MSPDIIVCSNKKLAIDTKNIFVTSRVIRAILHEPSYFFQLFVNKQAYESDAKMATGTDCCIVHQIEFSNDDDDDDGDESTPSFVRAGVR